jgi:ribosomal RNA-processing protein 1
MWMSDRPRTQQQLANDLAGLVDVLQEQNAMPFVQAFWKTMAREWSNIDVLRMDKFLLLVRRYWSAQLRYLEGKSWEQGAVEELSGILSSIPLNAADPKIPNGLRYHFIDIYVDELDQIDRKRDPKFPLETLLEPLRILQKSSPTKSVRTRAKEALADDRLQDWAHPKEDDVNEDSKADEDDFAKFDEE